MDVKGTDKQADHRRSTPGTIQAVRSNSDSPVRAWGAASTLPPAPQSAQSSLQCDHSRSRPVQNLSPTSAGEKTPKSIPGVTTGNSTSDKSGKITIDVMQTSRGVQRTRCRLDRRRSGSSAARQSVVGTAAHRLSRNRLDPKTSRPTGTAKIDLALQKTSNHQKSPST